MTRCLIPFFLVFACSCGDGVFNDTETEPEGYWPSGDPDAEFEGDLSQGEVIDLEWASTGAVACWPATENGNFSGAHVFHEFTEPEDHHLYVRVVPEKGVDVSLYALRYYGGEAQYPPDVTSPDACEAGFDQEHDSNPGKREQLFFVGHNEYLVLIGVAGADEATSGAYTVKVWVEPVV